MERGIEILDFAEIGQILQIHGMSCFNQVGCLCIPIPEF